MIDAAYPDPAAAAALATLTALALDAAFGDPPGLWRRIGHPVVWLGQVIAWGDARLNRGAPARRRIAGGALTLALVAAAGVAGWAATALVALPFGWLVLGAVCSPLLAQRSLFEHVEAVRAPLAAGESAAARSALGMIVGRDLDDADAGAMAGATIETLAESWSDGVAAPAFWLAFLGPAGLIAYKAVNTADSMIGYRTPRHAAFGWAAARLDDALNLIPARITCMSLALAALWTPGARAPKAWTAMRRDARRHRSPNAGWPEAACAGALGVRIGGPRSYGGVMTDEPFMGADGRRADGAADIAAAMRLTRRSTPLLWIGAAALAALSGWG